MSSVRCVFGTLLATVVAAACSDTTAPGTCDPTAPGPSIESARKDSIPPPWSDHKTIDDQMAEVARDIPGGWGGFFLENGEPTIYLVQPAQRNAAVAVLYDRGVGEPYDIRQAKVWKGRWDFGQLYDWYRYINWVAVGWPDSLYWRDLDEYRNRLAYGARSAEGADSLVAVFEAVDLPCELVQIRFGLETVWPK